MVDEQRPPGIELPPVAPMLMQSLRSVGYTTSAALADLVDNSIAAEARTVAIRFATTPTPFVAIIDDGHGMDETTLIAAMRFGSRDPRDPRTGMDLGRFGLGL
jgi:NAD(P)H-dependent flavin oxidoreductase YrpB (nitropropane dioxygenase family)